MRWRAVAFFGIYGRHNGAQGMEALEKTMEITLETLRQDEEISTFIRQADAVLGAIGYTEHSFGHVTRVANMAGEILQTLTYDARTVELARIAGYLHDIGNVVNRKDHAQSGAVMAFGLLSKMGMSAGEVAQVICAIGNHDEGTGAPVNAISGALILADKSDVRRSRVRDPHTRQSDIHDRVNFAVTASALEISAQRREIDLRITIDTQECSVMDYFEIFLTRMLLCRRAAEFLGLTFKLTINDVAM